MGSPFPAVCNVKKAKVSALRAQTWALMEIQQQVHTIIFCYIEKIFAVSMEELAKIP